MIRRTRSAQQHPRALAIAPAPLSRWRLQSTAITRRALFWPGGRHEDHGAVGAASTRAGLTDPCGERPGAGGALAQLDVQKIALLARGWQRKTAQSSTARPAEPRVEHAPHLNPWRARAKSQAFSRVGAGARLDSTSFRGPRGRMFVAVIYSCPPRAGDVVSFAVPLLLCLVFFCCLDMAFSRPFQPP